jgi:hypothetical protein
MNMLIVAVLGFMLWPLLPAQTALIAPKKNAASSAGSAADLQESDQAA